ncbi:MAG TPA: Hsp33 family molecular chaperone HslO [Casimicrobiaceae bacterium]|jgi:molecular chaperone Hsp33
MAQQPQSSDALTRFVFDAAHVRGAVITLSRSTREILACHSYPPALSRALAELCAASPLIGSTLKLEGSLIVQLAGVGPVRLIVVECNDALDIRATAQWNDAAAALHSDATLAELAGGQNQGRLTITLDPRSGGSLYQGIVTLEATTSARLIEHYLTTSEQLQSRVVLTTHDGAAAGLLVQRLPGTSSSDEATWAHVELLLDALAPDALLAAPTHTALLASVFPEDDLRVFEPRSVHFRCSCSLERVRNALRIAGRAEIEAAIAERGHVEVTCEFCNRRYTFAPDEARDVFSSHAAIARDATAASRH